MEAQVQTKPMYDYPKISQCVPKYEEFNPDGTLRSYGMFGYQGYCLEIVLNKEDEEGIERAVEVGWLDPKMPKHMQALGAPSLVSLMRSRKKHKAAGKLISLGFEE
jgi:hypothetical protein